MPAGAVSHEAKVSSMPEIFIDGTTELTNVGIYAISITTLKQLSDVLPDAVTHIIISL